MTLSVQFAALAEQLAAGRNDFDIRLVPKQGQEAGELRAVFWPAQPVAHLRQNELGRDQEARRVQAQGKGLCMPLVSRAEQGQEVNGIAEYRFHRRRPP